MSARSHKVASQSASVATDLKVTLLKHYSALNVLFVMIYYFVKLSHHLSWKFSWNWRRMVKIRMVTRMMEGHWRSMMRDGTSWLLKRMTMKPWT